MKKENMKKEIVYAFIDSQNLNLGVSKSIRRNRKLLYKGWKLDFKRFRVYLSDKHKVNKAFVFIGKLPGNEELYRRLKAFGFTLIFKPILEVTKNGKPVVKGNVDAELVLHSMIEYPNYSQAVIVSGDGDFHCLVEYLDRKQKLKCLLVPNRLSCSRLLWRFGKHMSYVHTLKGKLELKK